MPNIGTSPDTTADTRGGLGLEGMLSISRFIDAGGLFVTITGNASIPIDYGIVEGVAIRPTPTLQARGSVVESVIADKKSPIAYGYGDKLALYFSQAPVFQVSAAGGGRGGGFGGGGGPGGGGGGTPGAEAAGAQGSGRPTGRGTATDPDIVQGRPAQMGTPPAAGAGRGASAAAPGGEEGGPAQRQAATPPELRPRIVVRFAAENELLISGMMAGGRELANQPAVVDAPRGNGHVLLFANNPMWRNETQGSYFLLFNAILNYDHLGVGRTAEPPAAGRGASGGEEQ
jgi:hypothetical protein